jgi:hypothetical protein
MKHYLRRRWHSQHNSMAVHLSHHMAMVVVLRLDRATRIQINAFTQPVSHFENESSHLANLLQTVNHPTAVCHTANNLHPNNRASNPPTLSPHLPHPAPHHHRPLLNLSKTPMSPTHPVPKDRNPTTPPNTPKKCTLPSTTPQTPPTHPATPIHRFKHPPNRPRQTQKTTRLLSTPTTTILRITNSLHHSNHKPPPLLHRAQAITCHLNNIIPNNRVSRLQCHRLKDNRMRRRCRRGVVIRRLCRASRRRRGIRLMLLGRGRLRRGVGGIRRIFIGEEVVGGE